MKELIVTSPCFEAGGLIPVEHTGHGADRSPELQLSGLDERVVSLAVIMDDMSHPIPQYNHWTIWNLPAQPVIPGAIAHGSRLEHGAVQGVGYGKHRYRGPKPPFNWSHDYRFTVYALDCMLSISENARKKALLRAMEGHILQQGELTGYYSAISTKP